jgi:simple sugar transport system ATP-binding protein
VSTDGNQLDPPCLEARDVTKHFGGVEALRGVTMTVRRGEVTCLLGDNGAGKSTLIKILSGVHEPDSGEVLVDGQVVRLQTPRAAANRGIGTVYQDLAMIPLMPIVRNFFLGREPTKGRGPARRIDWSKARRVVSEELKKVGIVLRDPNQPVGTLSGGERQCIAIARAMYFGASTLILDEPTSALGVKEAAMVLRNVDGARSRGHGVVMISHNVAHAFLIGDRFTVLNRGRAVGDFRKGEVTRDELHTLMAGGAEIEKLEL